MAQKQFLDLTGLSTFKDLMTQYIGTEDAKSIRSMSISGNTVNFYRSTDATGTVAYTITLPDTSGLIPKMSNANGNRVVYSNSNGTVSESSIPTFRIVTGYFDDEHKIGQITAVSGNGNEIVATGYTIDNITGLIKNEHGYITDLESYVGSIPSGATATNVVDYIDELVDDCMPKGTNWLTGYIVGTSPDGTVYMGETGLGAIEDAVAALRGFGSQDTVADALDDKIDVISNATGGKIATTTSTGEVAESVWSLPAQGFEQVMMLTGYNGSIRASMYKQSDITELISDVSGITNYVGTIPSGATSTNVVDYINEIAGPKMPKIANASGSRIVSSNSNGTVSETDIVADNVVTGYFYDGSIIGQLVAVASIYNELEATGYTIDDLATKAYVGTIPSGASSSNVVAYVGEMTGSISNAQIDALFSAS